MANIGHEGDSEIDWVVNTAQDPRVNHYHRFEDWYLYNQDQKSMEAESLKVSTIRNQIGWTKHGRMKRIGSMPLHVFTVIRKLDPEFATATKAGKRKYYRFLLRHPQFTVR